MSAPGPADRGTIAAIVPAGGRARRFGSDKTRSTLDGVTLLERAVGACAGLGATPVVVVGPVEHAPSGTVAVREDPPFGGPVAALAAALAHVAGADLVAVVAADMPFAAEALPALVAAAATGAGGPGAADGAWAVDATGRHQPLLAVYRAAALRAALDAIGDPAGVPMRAVTGRLDLVEVPAGASAIDIDTPEDLARVGGGPR